MMPVAPFAPKPATNAELECFTGWAGLLVGRCHLRPLDLVWNDHAVVPRLAFVESGHQWVMGFLVRSGRGTVCFDTIVFLRGCLLLIGELARQDFPGGRPCLGFGIAIPLGATAALISLERLHEFRFWSEGAIIVGIAILAPRLTSVEWHKALAPFGALSYALSLPRDALLHLAGAIGLPVDSPLRFFGKSLRWPTTDVTPSALREPWLQPRRRRLVGPYIGRPLHV